MAECERRWSSCLQSAPANVVLLREKLIWVSLTVTFTCSATWNLWCLGVQHFNLASDDSRYYVTQILQRPIRVLLNINDVTLTKFQRICSVCVRKHNDFCVTSCLLRSFYRKHIIKNTNYDYLSIFYIFLLSLEENTPPTFQLFFDQLFKKNYLQRN